MPPPCSLSSRARTVAGTPNSRDLTGARAPLLSHTTARSRQASTSFESQATRAGRRLESQPAGTPQRYEPGSLPSRPGPATPTYNWAAIRAPATGVPTTLCDRRRVGVPTRESPHVSGPLVAVSTARGLALQVGRGFAPLAQRTSTRHVRAFTRSAGHA